MDQLLVRSSSAIVPSYSDRLALFRKLDADRDHMVSQLVEQYQALQVKYTEKCNDYLDLVQIETDLRKRNESHQFVLVVIDGDGAIFHDHLFARGREGGVEAACQLRAGIKSHLRSLYRNSAVDDWTLVVHVILNLTWLSKKLYACGICSNQDVFDFVHAFSTAQPLFDFIDVGAGKERADHKIRETLRVFIPNTQCRHVIFGPCADNGYLVVLEGYRDESDKITLFESRPAEPGFRNLGLPIISFPDVFRSDNLPAKPAGPVNTTRLGSYLTAPPPPSLATIPGYQPVPSPPPVAAALAVRQRTVPAAPQNGTPAVRHPSPPAPVASPVETIMAPASTFNSSSWATVSRSKPSAKNIDIASSRAVTAPAKRFYLVNGEGMRVDAELPPDAVKALRRLADRIADGGNLCNEHYLRGNCTRPRDCPYAHTPARLPPDELNALRLKARTLTCPSWHDCDDPDCTFGHHCQTPRKCFHGKDCYFVDTHDMDITPARRIFEDGTEEWV